MLSINPNKCIGCGKCAGLFPDNFAMDDYGKSYVKKSDGGEPMVGGCPVHAIEEYKDEHYDKSTDLEWGKGGNKSEEVGGSEGK